MSVAIAQSAVAPVTRRHAAWVRFSHWILTASVVTLAISGVFILMVHPRLYWGEVGNDLTPALIELPISRNHRHGGWEGATPFFANAGSPVSASRTFDIFNQNGWARSLHFLAAWCLVLPGAVYLLYGTGGHFRANLLPTSSDLAPRRLWSDAGDHLRFRMPRTSARGHYGVLQKCAYTFVVFVNVPLIVLTGLAMSPAVTAALPVLRMFGGYQSARTIHFFAFVALIVFAFGHVVMVIRSGFRRQIRAMTIGE